MAPPAEPAVHPPPPVHALPTAAGNTTPAAPHPPTPPADAHPEVLPLILSVSLHWAFSPAYGSTAHSHITTTTLIISGIGATRRIQEMTIMMIKGYGSRDFLLPTRDSLLQIAVATKPYPSHVSATSIPHADAMIRVMITRISTIYWAMGVMLPSTTL